MKTQTGLIDNIMCNKLILHLKTILHISKLLCSRYSDTRVAIFKHLCFIKKYAEQSSKYCFQSLESLPHIWFSSNVYTNNIYQF